MKTEESVKTELRAFVPEVLEITTINGEKIQIPLVTSVRQELEILALINELLSIEELDAILEAGEALSFEVGTQAKRGSWISQARTLLGMAPKLPQFVKILIKKEEDWIMDNLDINLIVQIIVPFSRKYRDMGNSWVQLVRSARLAREPGKTVPIQ